MPHSVIVVPRKSSIAICIVFHGDGLARIQNADPGVVPLAEAVKLHPQIRVLPLEVFDIVVCHEPDIEVFQAKCRELGSKTAILDWLCRNWEDRPGEDTPPVRIEWKPEGK